VCPNKQLRNDGDKQVQRAWRSGGCTYTPSGCYQSSQVLRNFRISSAHAWNRIVVLGILYVAWLAAVGP